MFTIKVSAGVVSSEASLPSVRTATFFLCPPVVSVCAPWCVPLHVLL